MEADSLIIVCAGMEGLFSLDDAVCAGALVQRIRAAADVDFELNDAAMGAVEMALTFRVNAHFLGSISTGKRLIEIGLQDDLEICAEMDRHSVVPEMDDRVIQLRSPGAGSSRPDA
jgi:2-phosphosulfolactate phosphatase